MEQTDESQDIYDGPTTGQPYYPLDACRLRFFGGSSNHWGGWTRPLDERDFLPRSNNPMSGWPIAKADLDPYAPEADDILNLPPNRPPPDMFNGRMPEFEPAIFRFSRPVTRFGEKYGPELKAAPNITVVLDANLVDLRTNDAGTQVTRAVFRSYQRDEPFEVAAKVFILCLGGIENARALLNANSQQPAGLGNQQDLVGRFFLEHPHAPLGKAVIRKPIDWMMVYQPTPAFMRERDILSFGIRIGSFGAWNGPEFTGRLEDVPKCEVPFDDLLAMEMKGEPPPCPNLIVDVFAACEQSLDPNNRVRLTDERDQFGLRRIALDWHLSDRDLRTIHTAALDIAGRFAEFDVGRMQIVDWIVNDEAPGSDNVWGGNHHMGTTRMSDSPATGVVDGNCRVHGLDNLYIGGSSVFATSGHSNPTYTIVQLALRLGDHINQKLDRA